MYTCMKYINEYLMIFMDFYYLNLEFSIFLLKVLLTQMKLVKVTNPISFSNFLKNCMNFFDFRHPGVKVYM